MKKEKCQVNDVTIDVCVLMSGSGLGDKQHSHGCFTLLNTALADDKFLLALDDRKRIQHQYERKLREGTYGLSWLGLMASRNKIKPIPWKVVNKGTKTKLREAHFDKEDFKYVETAAQTDCKVLVSYVPCYSARVCKILRKRLRIRVHHPKSCLSLRSSQTGCPGHSRNQ